MKINHKILLISLMCCSCFNLQAQDYSISAMFGKNNYNIKGFYDDWDENKYLNYYENETGFNFGIGLTKNQSINNFFNLQVLYSTLSYQSHANVKFIFENPADSSIIPQSFDINVGYLDFPISWGHHFINKDSSNFRFSTQIGLRPSFLISSNNTIIAIDGSVINRNPMRKVTVTPFVGLNIGYNFSNNLTAYFSIYYNQHFNPYDYSGGSFPNNIPLVLQLEYSL